MKLEENGTYPAAIAGKQSLNKELTQHLLLTFTYSDGGSEVATGEFLACGKARDCYKAQTKTLGGLVVKLQRAGRAKASSRLEHTLSQNVKVKDFVLPVLWCSETVAIVIQHRQTTKYGDKWAVIVTRLATCDALQAFQHIVDKPMTDGLAAALLGLLRNVLGMLLRAIRAGLRLGNMHIKHLSFDGDLKLPGRGVINMLGYKNVEVDKPFAWSKFSHTVTRLLCNVAATMGSATGWDGVAAELTWRITRQWKKFAYCELCSSMSVDELVGSIRLDGCLRREMPINSREEVRAKALASQHQPPPTTASRSVAGSAFAPRPAFAPAQSSPDIQKPLTKPTWSPLMVPLGVACPEIKLPVPVIFQQARACPLPAEVNMMEERGRSGADPGQHLCVFCLFCVSMFALPMWCYFPTTVRQELQMSLLAHITLALVLASLTLTRR